MGQEKTQVGVNKEDWVGDEVGSWWTSEGRPKVVKGGSTRREDEKERTKGEDGEEW